MVFLLQKKLKAEFAKEREQFQTKIADGDRVNKLQQVLSELLHVHAFFESLCVSMQV